MNGLCMQKDISTSRDRAKCFVRSLFFSVRVRFIAGGFYWLSVFYNIINTVVQHACLKTLSSCAWRRRM